MLKKAKNLVWISIIGGENSDVTIEMSEIDSIGIFGGKFYDLNFF